MTFTGLDFQPCHASRFLLGVGQNFLLDNLKMSTCFERLLPSETSFCRQSDVIHISNFKEVVSGYRYSWTHEDIQPWGQKVPIQCQGCGTIRNWLGTKLQGKYIFVCRTQSCETKIEFPSPVVKKWLAKSASGGRWMFVDISLSSP